MSDLTQDPTGISLFRGTALSGSFKREVAEYQHSVCADLFSFEPDRKTLDAGKGNGEGAMRVFFSPDSRKILLSNSTVGNSCTTLWDLGQAECEMSYPGSSDDFVVTGSAFSSSGVVASVTLRGVCRLHDSGSGALLKEISLNDFLFCTAFSKQGMLAVGGQGGIHLYDQDYTHVKTFPSENPAFTVKGLDFSSCGRYLVAACQKNISVYDCTKEVEHACEAVMNLDGALTARFFQNDRYILASGMPLYIWDWRNNESEKVEFGFDDLDLNYMRAACNEGGEFFVVTACRGPQVGRKTVILDASTGKSLFEKNLLAEENAVFHEQVSPDGRTLCTCCLVASGHLAVKFWSTSTGELLASLYPHLDEDGGFLWTTPGERASGRNPFFYTNRPDSVVIKSISADGSFSVIESDNPDYRSCYLSLHNPFAVRNALGYDAPSRLSGLLEIKNGIGAGSGLVEHMTRARITGK